MRVQYVVAFRQIINKNIHSNLFDCHTLVECKGLFTRLNLIMATLRYVMESYYK